MSRVSWPCLPAGVHAVPRLDGKPKKLYTLRPSSVAEDPILLARTWADDKAGFNAYVSQLQSERTASRASAQHSVESSDQLAGAFVPGVNTQQDAARPDAGGLTEPSAPSDDQSAGASGAPPLPAGGDPAEAAQQGGARLPPLAAGASPAQEALQGGAGQSASCNPNDWRSLVSRGPGRMLVDVGSAVGVSVPLGFRLHFMPCQAGGLPSEGQQKGIWYSVPDGCNLPGGQSAIHPGEDLSRFLEQNKSHQRCSGLSASSFIVSETDLQDAVSKALGQGMGERACLLTADEADLKLVRASLPACCTELCRETPSVRSQVPLATGVSPSGKGLDRREQQDLSPEERGTRIELTASTARDVPSAPEHNQHPSATAGALVNLASSKGQQEQDHSDREQPEQRSESCQQTDTRKAPLDQARPSQLQSSTVPKSKVTERTRHVSNASGKRQGETRNERLKDGTIRDEERTKDRQSQKVDEGHAKDRSRGSLHGSDGKDLQQRSHLANKQGVSDRQREGARSFFSEKDRLKSETAVAEKHSKDDKDRPSNKAPSDRRPDERDRPARPSDKYDKGYSRGTLPHQHRLGAPSRRPSDLHVNGLRDPTKHVSQKDLPPYRRSLSDNKHKVPEKPPQLKRTYTEPYAAGRMPLGSVQKRKEIAAEGPFPLKRMEGVRGSTTDARAIKRPRLDDGSLDWQRGQPSLGWKDKVEGARRGLNKRPREDARPSARDPVKKTADSPAMAAFGGPLGTKDKSEQAGRISKEIDHSNKRTDATVDVTGATDRQEAPGSERKRKAVEEESKHRMYSVQGEECSKLQKLKQVLATCRPSSGSARCTAWDVVQKRRRSKAPVNSPVRKPVSRSTPNAQSGPPNFLTLFSVSGERDLVSLLLVPSVWKMGREGSRMKWKLTGMTRSRDNFEVPVTCWKVVLEPVPGIMLQSDDHHWIRLDMKKPHPDYSTFFKKVEKRYNMLQTLVQKAFPSVKDVADLFKDHLQNGNKNLVMSYLVFITDHLGGLPSERKEKLAKKVADFRLAVEEGTWPALLSKGPAPEPTILDKFEAAATEVRLHGDGPEHQALLTTEADDEVPLDPGLPLLDPRLEEVGDVVCILCDDGGEVLCCDGICQRAFHATKEQGEGSGCKTLGIPQDFYDRELSDGVKKKSWMCRNCKANEHQCYICGKLGKSSATNSKGSEVLHCEVIGCTYFYHPGCLAKWEAYGASEAEQKQRARTMRDPHFFLSCPLHKCANCGLLEAHMVGPEALVKCRRCPTAYHVECLPKNLPFQSTPDKKRLRRVWGVKDEELGEPPFPRRICYCKTHKIDLNLETPPRNHILWPRKKGLIKVGEKSIALVGTSSEAASLQKQPKELAALQKDDVLPSQSTEDREIAALFEVDEGALVKEGSKAESLAIEIVKEDAKGTTSSVLVHSNQRDKEDTTEKTPLRNRPHVDIDVTQKPLAPEDQQLVNGSAGTPKQAKASAVETGGDWWRPLLAVPSLPTNSGRPIRDAVQEALNRQPPGEPPRAVLQEAISKGVYKSNAAGPTKRMVMELLEKYVPEEAAKLKKTRTVRSPRTVSSPKAVASLTASPRGSGLSYTGLLKDAEHSPLPKALAKEAGGSNEASCNQQQDDSSKSKQTEEGEILGKQHLAKKRRIKVIAETRTAVAIGHLKSSDGQDSQAQVHKIASEALPASKPFVKLVNDSRPERVGLLAETGLADTAKRTESETQAIGTGVVALPLQEAPKDGGQLTLGLLKRCSRGANLEDTEVLKARLKELKAESEAVVTEASVKAQLRVPSIYAYESRRTIPTKGHLSKLCHNVIKAISMLKAGDHQTVQRIVTRESLIELDGQWSTMAVYLGPFIHGSRYTSYGRHFTQKEKLQEIVERLHPYVDDGDTIVDFCCGANDFSLILHSRLKELRKYNCNFKNFDILTPKNEFSFTKKDWLTVTKEDIPVPGDKLIMGLNPPFGVRGAQAWEFVRKALTFQPKLLILIVPSITEKPPRAEYTCLWEDHQICSGKSFYLPGSLDKDEKELDQWNKISPPLYLYTCNMFLEKHAAIAHNQGHFSRPPQSEQNGWQQQRGGAWGGVPLQAPAQQVGNQGPESDTGAEYRRMQEQLQALEAEQMALSGEQQRRQVAFDRGLALPALSERQAAQRRKQVDLDRVTKTSIWSREMETETHKMRMELARVPFPARKGHEAIRSEQLRQYEAARRAAIDKEAEDTLLMLAAESRDPFFMAEYHQGKARLQELQRNRREVEARLQMYNQLNSPGAHLTGPLHAPAWPMQPSLDVRRQTLPAQQTLAQRCESA